MYSMKKGGSKNPKQQAAIAMSMKAAGKKPKKMREGGPNTTPLNDSTRVAEFQKKALAKMQAQNLAKKASEMAAQNARSQADSYINRQTMDMLNKRKAFKTGGSAESFKKLAFPYNKATYADKIAGATMKKGGTVKSKKK